jgi:hypothetical protein
MLNKIFNQLEEAAIKVGASTYDIGVRQLKNNLGSEDYPLIFIELPLSIEESGPSIVFNFIGYAVYLRRDKLITEELDQISDAFVLARLYISELSKYGYVGGSYLTYSGIELADFTDSVNGVRFEFKLEATVVC